MDEWIALLDFYKLNIIHANAIFTKDYAQINYFKGIEAKEGERPILVIDTRDENPKVRIIMLSDNPQISTSYYLNKADLQQEGFKTE